MSLVVLFALGYLLGVATVAVFTYLALTARRRSIERSIRYYQRSARRHD